MSSGRGFCQPVTVTPPASMWHSGWHAAERPPLPARGDQSPWPAGQSLFSLSVQCHDEPQIARWSHISQLSYCAPGGSRAERCLDGK